MDGADILVPETVTLTVAGVAVEVRPLTVGQIPAVLRALKGVDFSAGIAADDLPRLLEAHGEQLIEAVAIAVKRTTEFVSNLDPVEFLTLASKVVEVNADFFAHRLAPVLAEVMQRVAAAAKPGAGPTPSRS